MNKAEVVKLILKDRPTNTKLESATAFAPTNIALIKYWGKRDCAINLPVTDSLSIALANKGATTKISLIDQAEDEYWVNEQLMAADSAFSTRLNAFLNLFRFQRYHFKVETKINIPIAAGLASSACGFAAVVKALNELFAWQLSDAELSILSRMGSGSASRSIWQGFVHWQAGIREDGMDSHGIALKATWPQLCVGLAIFNSAKKSIGSTEAMNRTVATSKLYSAWPQQVSNELAAIKSAIANHDFNALGMISEHNALSMHATMLSAWPPILYAQPETLSMMNLIWQLRDQGLPIYFTQDAGPNLKLLFEEKASDEIRLQFPNVEIIRPFTC
jgi:diphosphomevalonate decarboxylase